MHLLVALHQLPRSGWSVGRAGLGEKRPTLPKGRILPHKAVGLGFFLVVSLYGSVDCCGGNHAN